MRLLRAIFVSLVGFLYAPLFLLIIFSFNDSTTPSFPLAGLTSRWYRQLFENEGLIDALITSAEVAAISSIVAVVLGLLAAIAIVRLSFPGKSFASTLLVSPLVIPYVVLGIALLILFKSVGFPLSIVTVAIGHVVLSIPFTILVLVPRLERIDARLEEAARDLGAGTLRTFRSITLPLIAPALVSAGLIAFTLSFDEFAVASFLVGDRSTFPMFLFSQLRFPQLLPPAIAAAVVVMISSLLLILLAEIGRRVAERRLHA